MIECNLCQYSLPIAQSDSPGQVICLKTGLSMIRATEGPGFIKSIETDNPDECPDYLVVDEKE